MAFSQEQNLCVLLIKHIAITFLLKVLLPYIKKGSIQNICYNSEFHAISNHQVTRYSNLKKRKISCADETLSCNKGFEPTHFMYGSDLVYHICGTLRA